MLHFRIGTWPYPQTSDEAGKKAVSDKNNSLLLRLINCFTRLVPGFFRRESLVGIADLFLEFLELFRLETTYVLKLSLSYLLHQHKENYHVHRWCVTSVTDAYQASPMHHNHHHCVTCVTYASQASQMCHKRHRCITDASQVSQMHHRWVTKITDGSQASQKHHKHHHCVTCIISITDVSQMHHRCITSITDASQAS